MEKHAKRALRNGERSKLANILVHLPATDALQSLFFWNPTKQAGEDVQDLVCGQHAQWLINQLNCLHLDIYMLLCKYTNLVCVTQPSS